MLRIPKIQMVLVLLVLSVAALVRFFSLELLFRLIWLISVTLLFEYIFWRIRKVSLFIPSAGVITALIIFLLADPSSRLYQYALASVLAVAIKQFMRLENRHVLNPAVSGLFLSALFFGLPISWWGVGWGYIPLIMIVLGAGYVSLVSLRQYYIIIPFLASTLITSTFLLGGPESALGQLLVGSFWFFTLVMLPEPMTAARFQFSRIIYGVFVALIPFAASEWNFIADPLIASLLMGNILAMIVENIWKLKV